MHLVTFQLIFQEDLQTGCRLEKEDAKAKNCENDLCDFSTETVKDADGNLITTIKFSIITKLKNIKVEDIPVIDGIRGIYPERIPPLNSPGRQNFPQVIIPNKKRIER